MSIIKPFIKDSFLEFLIKPVSSFNQKNLGIDLLLFF